MENKIRERSESAWKKSYNAYLTKRAETAAKGIAIKDRLSFETFKRVYSDNYATKKKSVIRAIVNGDILISGRQSVKLAQGFKESKIEQWIEEQKARDRANLDAEAEFYSHVENKGKKFESGEPLLRIDPMIEGMLKSLKVTKAKDIRSPEFMGIYEAIAPYVKAYNASRKERNLFTELIYME